MEETFVRQLLAPHLSVLGVGASARLLGNARQRNRRGGICNWPEAKADIVRHLRQDDDWVVGLMADYYALPAFGNGAWPSRAAAANMPFQNKASAVQNAIVHDISIAMGANFNPARFVPCIVMHEFEALLFSDCATFANAIGHEYLASDFQAIRNQFQTPEWINDSPQTAPSKRIKALLPSYQKPLLGTIAAKAIGIQAIKFECTNFATWLGALEAMDS